MFLFYIVSDYLMSKDFKGLNLFGKLLLLFVLTLNYDVLFPHGFSDI